jgi:YbbR domain-containing protein
MIERLKAVLGIAGMHLRDLFVHNLHLKAIAFLLTMAVYLWVSEDRETQVIAAAPLRISVPENQILLEPEIDKVKVTLRGRWSTLNQFDQTDMQPVTLELSNSDDGKLVPITSDNVHVPVGLRVVSIEPSFIRVDMESRVEKRVEVRPRIVGRTRSSYVVGEVRVEPPEVEVSGPKNVMQDFSSISTEPIDVTGRVRTFKKEVQLQPDSPKISYDLDEPLTVTVPIRTEEIRRTFEDVAVQGVDTTYRTTIEPSTLRLTIRGPRALVEDVERETLHAIIDLSKEDGMSPGTFEKEVDIRNLPEDVDVVRVHPKHFLVTTRRDSSNSAADAGPSNGSP